VETSKQLLSNLFPLLKEFQDVRKAVLVPLPRYLYGSCCSDPEHVSNLADPDHVENLAKSLDSTHKLWRGMVFREKLCLTKICNTTRLLTDGQQWGQDPVHPSPDGYRQVTDYVLAGLRALCTGKESVSEETGAKRGLAEEDAGSLSAPKRPTWVSRSETFATRSEVFRGRGRGYGGGSGCWGGRRGGGGWDHRF
jgi:hypothetical protein